MSSYGPVPVDSIVSRPVVSDVHQGALAVLAGDVGLEVVVQLVANCCEHC